MRRTGLTPRRADASLRPMKLPISSRFRRSRAWRPALAGGVAAAILFWARPLAGAAEAPASPPAPSRPTPASLQFQPDGQGGFTFNTGILRGRLHAEGRSLGLTDVVYVPTGARVDRGHGLLGHYRVFANGRRFGGGAWDWPSTATRLADGRVEVRWAATEDRPFALQAVYQLIRPGAVMVETQVEPLAELRGFEVFLASYFDPAFTNSFVAARHGQATGFATATPDRGEWQMFPRDAAARALAEDGRWQLEPHPVAWTFPAELAGPTIRAHRRAPGRGLLATFSADISECFAVATPHQTEAHYSTYLSLFGRTLAAGRTARAHVSLVITGPAGE